MCIRRAARRRSAGEPLYRLAGRHAVSSMQGYGCVGARSHQRPRQTGGRQRLIAHVSIPSIQVHWVRFLRRTPLSLCQRSRRSQVSSQALSQHLSLPAQPQPSSLTPLLHHLYLSVLSPFSLPTIPCKAGSKNPEWGIHRDEGAPAGQCLPAPKDGEVSPPTAPRGHPHQGKNARDQRHIDLGLLIHGLCGHSEARQPCQGALNLCEATHP